MARLYEYQGKELLREAGFAVPRGGVARTPDEARDRAEAVGGPVVLKAQVFVTGRAAAGGIRFADTPDEAASVGRPSDLERTLGHGSPPIAASSQSESAASTTVAPRSPSGHPDF